MSSRNRFGDAGDSSSDSDEDVPQQHQQPQQQQGEKKKKKKKSKGAAGAGAGAGAGNGVVSGSASAGAVAAAHDYDDNDYDDDAEDDDDGFVTVTNTKRIKAQERAARKAEELLRLKLMSEVPGSAIDVSKMTNQQLQKFAEKKKEEEEETSSWWTRQGAPNPIKKQPKKKKERESFDTADDVAEVVTRLLRCSANDRLSLAEVGSKITELSGAAWNAKLKKQFGPMRDFLAARKEFVLEANDYVTFKVKPGANAPGYAPAAPKLQAQGATAAAGAAAPAPPGGKKNKKGGKGGGGGGADRRERTCTPSIFRCCSGGCVACFLLVLLPLLLAAAVAVAAFALQEPRAVELVEEAERFLAFWAHEAQRFVVQHLPKHGA